MRGKENIVFQDEGILVKKCMEWDRLAQNALYKLFAPKMFTVCLRYSKNREEAEDTLHEGFMRVFEKINMYRKEGSLEGWIRTIMYHCAIEKFRKRKPEEENIKRIDDDNGDFDHYTDADVESIMSSKELIHLIQQLTPRYRMVFNLYVFEGLTHKEIAIQLNVTEGTSKSNLSDARNILQRAINKNLEPAQLQL